MQIEKLNENQIRLTLSKKDLEQKQLRLSELAYGSSRARELLHEMIQQASTELGFEVDNIPLMVEAIPISGDCLVLVITKIDDPEKLDDKLSLLTKLAEMIKDDNYDPNLFDIEDNDDLLDDYQAAIDDDDDDFVSVDVSEEDESVIDSSLDPLGLTAPFAQALAEAKKDATEGYGSRRGQAAKRS
jgi:adapter protein MecA 1/2